MIRRLAVIPARGGSKRIPGKNIKDFCGKPMISYILDVAKESGLFSHIHVSTESAEIKSIVEGLGFTIYFMRSAELTDDHTPLMPVLKYVTETYRNQGFCFDQVWLLMACAPLVEAEDLRGAAALFEQSVTNSSLLAVAEYPAPVEWAFDMGEGGTLKPIQPGMFSMRSQDIGKKYFDAGIFAVYSSEAVLASNGAGSDSGFIGFIIERKKAIDIDEAADWELAELIYKAQHSIPKT